RGKSRQSRVEVDSRKSKGPASVSLPGLRLFWDSGLRLLTVDARLLTLDGDLSSTQRKGQFDRDEHRHRLAHPHPGPEAPLARGFDGFLIEDEVRVERSQHQNVSDAAVGPQDAL